MNSSEGPKYQTDKPGLFGNIIRKITKYIKGSANTLKLDENDTEGQKIIEKMQNAGIDDSIIAQTIKSRTAAFQAITGKKQDLKNKNEQMKREKYKELQEKYREKLPEGSEAQTKNIFFKDISFKNIDVAVKDGKVLKILNEGNSLESSGGTYNTEALDKILEPLRKIEIVLNSSGYEGDGEVEHLSKVELDLNRLNMALEKGKTELLLKDDEIEMNIES